jgi:hypothetical protein
LLEVGSIEHAAPLLRNETGKAPSVLRVCTSGSPLRRRAGAAKRYTA